MVQTYGPGSIGGGPCGDEHCKLVEPNPTPTHTPSPTPYPYPLPLPLPLTPTPIPNPTPNQVALTAALGHDINTSSLQVASVVQVS